MKQQAIHMTNPQKVTALYCRLSKDDGNQDESTSIQTQKAMLSSLQEIHDSPSSIENYYTTGALSGMKITIPEYMQQVQQVTVDRLAEVAAKVELHSVFMLKGVQ